MQFVSHLSAVLLLSVVGILFFSDLDPLSLQKRSSDDPDEVYGEFCFHSGAKWTSTVHSTTKDNDSKTTADRNANPKLDKIHPIYKTTIQLSPVTHLEQPEIDSTSLIPGHEPHTQAWDAPTPAGFPLQTLSSSEATTASAVISTARSPSSKSSTRQKDNRTIKVVPPYEIGPDDCCFNFYPRVLNKKYFRSYHLTDPRCAKAGVILVSIKGRNICADPSLSWVDSIMKRIDN